MGIRSLILYLLILAARFSADAQENQYQFSRLNNNNNGAIRTLKVKQKVSGGFRSIDGVEAFDVMRSVIDTTIKCAQNVFYAINLIANFNPK